MNSKVLDIICAICMVVITITILVVAYFLLQPEKVYVQKWTSPETGQEYILSNYSIIEINNERK